MKVKDLILLLQAVPPEAEDEGDEKATEIVGIEAAYFPILNASKTAKYDPVEKMKTHLDQFKLTFPSVYESDNQAARLTSNHYLLRTEAGDKRKWGTPWYVLLDPATLKPASRPGRRMSGRCARFWVTGSIET